MLEKSTLKLYRKRLMPDECILLKDDIILHADDNMILTRWHTIRPKENFDHGYSCYFQKEGIKVSQFCRPDNTLLYWYCDIVTYEYRESENALIVTDLLADVIVYPDNRYEVIDLDELAQAQKNGLISTMQVNQCLEQLQRLLSRIYRNEFQQLLTAFERMESIHS